MRFTEDCIYFVLSLKDEEGIALSCCTEVKEIHRGFYLLCVECERWRERYINLIKEYL